MMITMPFPPLPPEPPTFPPPPPPPPAPLAPFPPFPEVAATEPDPPSPPKEKNGFQSWGPPLPSNEPAAGVSGRCCERDEFAIAVQAPPWGSDPVTPAPPDPAWQS